jgi:hypothetical protein
MAISQSLRPNKLGEHKPGKEDASMMCQMLELLSRYLQWLLPPLLLPRSVDSNTSATHSSSSSTRRALCKGKPKQRAHATAKGPSSSRGGSSNSTSSSLARRASSHDLNLSVCMLLHRTLLDDAYQAGQEVAAALRPYLVQEGCGELAHHPWQGIIKCPLAQLAFLISSCIQLWA